MAVVVCPGGSYSWLDIPTEGVAVCEWLRQNGINAYLLRYRVASVPAYIFGFRVLGIGHKWPDMLEDVETALHYVYDHAAEDGVDTSRIGVMGFSAGGHLTMSAFAFNRTPYKPKFLVPVYPVVTFAEPVLTHKRSRRGALGVWRQWDETLRDSLSVERHVRPDFPPVFMVACDDDPVVNPTLAYFLEQNHGITLPSFEKENQLQRFLVSVANLVQSREGWSVSTDVVLSTFQFQKLFRYTDIRFKLRHLQAALRNRLHKSGAHHMGIRHGLFIVNIGNRLVERILRNFCG